MDDPEVEIEQLRKRFAHLSPKDQEKELGKAIEQMIEYMFTDEESNFMAGEAPLGKHIFGSLVVLDEWLQRRLKRKRWSS